MESFRRTVKVSKKLTEGYSGCIIKHLEGCAMSLLCWRLISINNVRQSCSLLDFFFIKIMRRKIKYLQMENKQRNVIFNMILKIMSLLHVFIFRSFFSSRWSIVFNLSDFGKPSFYKLEKSRKGDMQWVELKRRVGPIEREREIFFIRFGWPIRNRQAIDQITHTTLYQDAPSSSFPYQFTQPNSFLGGEEVQKQPKNRG